MKLGLGVKGNGPSLGILVHQFFGLPVDAARGSENKTFHAVAGGDFGHHAGCRIVDLQRVFLIFRAGRISDNGGQVNHVADVGHGLNDVADVAAITFEEFKAGMAEQAANGVVAIHQAVEKANFAAEG